MEEALGGLLDFEDLNLDLDGVFQHII